jgi:hypothetical protein
LLTENAQNVHIWYKLHGGYYFVSTKTKKLFGELNGVDKNIATHLWGMGIRTKAGIATTNPKKIYRRGFPLHSGTGETTE